MMSPGATAVSSTSVPMRNWARLRVTGGDDGFDTAGWVGREIGMIAQAVKNGIQASRKRAARRCIGSESNKEEAQSHGGMRVTPHGRPEAARGVQPGLPGPRRRNAQLRWAMRGQDPPDPSSHVLL